MNNTLLKRAFWGSLIVTVLLLAAMARIDGHLKTPDCPLGIVSFELCAYNGSCGTIVKTWSEHSRLMAALSLGVDYLFMAAYPAPIFFGLLLIAGKMPRRPARATVLIAWVTWLAGIADAVENYALVRMLLDTAVVSRFAWYASGFATAKFAVLALSLLWLIGFGAVYRKKGR